MRMAISPGRSASTATVGLNTNRVRSAWAEHGPPVIALFVARRRFQRLFHQRRSLTPAIWTRVWPQAVVFGDLWPLRDIKSERAHRCPGRKEAARPHLLMRFRFTCDD
jgi:hypothetical protein